MRMATLLSLVAVTVLLVASLPAGAQQPVVAPPPQIPYGARSASNRPRSCSLAPWRNESVQEGAAVQLTIPDVGVFEIPIVRRPLPRRGGFSMLYRCPGCGQPKRHLCLRSLVIGRLVDYQGPLCTACAGLRWASQGRYIGVLHRAVRAGLGLQGSDRFPFPRHPRDPRAISDPRLILDEFPDLVGDRPRGPGPD